ncbi:thioredoxin domain-containing protein 17 isoform X1 [Excalfactoria chinensis]|uniref:thioredoxin domain-containing protein 17 isoform X1 n=1 Tax=Excalfactoria chinensis TaxID=46218 RepID=UPI003B3AEDDD
MCQDHQILDPLRLTSGIKNRNCRFCSSRIGTLPSFVSSARTVPPVATAPELTYPRPPEDSVTTRRRRPEGQRKAASCAQRPEPCRGRPAAARSWRRASGTQRESTATPRALQEPQPGPLRSAVQTRGRRPPPLRPSGSSAAPQYGNRDGPGRGCAFPPWVATSRGRHGLGGEAGPWVQRVRTDGAELPRPADFRALLRRQGCQGPELVPGLRDGWKDPNNEFRKNLKLTGVPTLLKYGTPQKLVEEECFKADLVRMLFTED